jgi:hypothetical protein
MIELGMEPVTRSVTGHVTGQVRSTSILYQLAPTSRLRVRTLYMHMQACTARVVTGLGPTRVGPQPGPLFAPWVITRVGFCPVGWVGQTLDTRPASLVRFTARAARCIPSKYVPKLL